MTRPARVRLRAMAGALAITAAITAAIAAVPLAATAATAAATPAAAANAAVPAGFTAMSITWDTPQHGWILGRTRCGKKTCTRVLGSTDGGKVWEALGTVPARIPSLGQGGLGVTEIRFATPRAGWAFGPSLLATSNGGRTWAAVPIPGHGQQVLALAASSAGAFAVVSPCKFGGGNCKKPLALWRTTAPAARTWTQVTGIRLPGNFTASVSAYGRTVYVVDPLHGDSASLDKFYASTDGGRHFAARKVPCDSQPIIALVQVVATSASHVDLLCDGDPGFSKADKFVYRSANTAKTTKFAGTMDPFGIQAQLAASSSGNLAVATWSDGSFIDINDSQGTTWKMIIGFGDGGAGWNDITYVTDNEAWVVYAPANTFAGLGKVLVTRDGGRHWNVITL
jgi:photosystem II stability/assembly factor-like uncharacterized protein